MAELSGSLEDVGLAALIRFLGQVGSTGVLTVARDRAAGDLAFVDGRPVAATFGSARGADAVEAMAVALADGWFAYTDGDVPTEANVSLSSEDLEERLDGIARIRAGRPPLELSAIPRLVDLPEDASANGRLSLERGALRLLLAIDGRRSVGDLLAGGRPVQVVEHLYALLAAGLIELHDESAEAHSPGAPPSPAPAPSPTPADRAPGPAPARRAQPRSPGRRAPAPPAANGTASPAQDEPLAPAPGTDDTVDTAMTGRAAAIPPAEAGTADAATSARRAAGPPAMAGPVDAAGTAGKVATPPAAAGAEAPGQRPVDACPKLGFADDPDACFPRPTRTHRCFAFGRPLVVSGEQQRALCLTADHVDCPRLTGFDARPAGGRRPSGLAAAVAAGAVPSPTFDDAVADPDAPAQDTAARASAAVPVPTTPEAPMFVAPDAPWPRASAPSARAADPLGPADPDASASPAARRTRRTAGLAQLRDSLPVSGQLREGWELVTGPLRVQAILIALATLAAVIGLVILALTMDSGGDLDQALPEEATAVAAANAGSPVPELQQAPAGRLVRPGRPPVATPAAAAPAPAGP
jgi:Domain of unknown function (DUF4388)